MKWLLRVGSDLMVKLAWSTKVSETEHIPVGTGVIKINSMELLINLFEHYKEFALFDFTYWPYPQRHLMSINFYVTWFLMIWGIVYPVAYPRVYRLFYPQISKLSWKTSTGVTDLEVSRMEEESKERSKLGMYLMFIRRAIVFIPLGVILSMVPILGILFVSITVVYILFGVVGFVAILLLSCILKS